MRLIKKLKECLNSQFRNEVKDKLETKQRELTEAKKESRKRKKMIAVYQVSGVRGVMRGVCGVDE